MARAWMKFKVYWHCEGHVGVGEADLTPEAEINLLSDYTKDRSSIRTLRSACVVTFILLATSNRNKADGDIFDTHLAE
jgi:hypothetical protein